MQRGLHQVHLFFKPLQMLISIDRCLRVTFLRLALLRFFPSCFRHMNYSVLEAVSPLCALRLPTMTTAAFWMAWEATLTSVIPATCSKRSEAHVRTRCLTASALLPCTRLLSPCLLKPLPRWARECPFCITILQDYSLMFEKSRTPSLLCRLSLLQQHVMKSSPPPRFQLRRSKPHLRVVLLLWLSTWSATKRASQITSACFANRLSYLKRKFLLLLVQYHLFSNRLKIKISLPPLFLS